MSLRLKIIFNLEHFFKLNKLNILRSYKERKKTKIYVKNLMEKSLISIKKRDSSKK